MWSHFVIDHFGLIETAQSVKEKLLLQKTIRDESIRGPDLFGTLSTPTAVSIYELSPSPGVRGDGNTPHSRSDIIIHDEEEEQSPTPQNMATPPLLNPKSKS